MGDSKTERGETTKSQTMMREAKRTEPSWTSMGVQSHDQARLKLLSIQLHRGRGKVEWMFVLGV